MATRQAARIGSGKRRENMRNKSIEMKMALNGESNKHRRQRKCSGAA